MIINHETHNIESSELPTKQFTINVTAHAFDVLISKQYKNKPESIIREILSNALDAHIEANQPQPVEVTLPTILNPTLTIKDYGTGISPDNIDNVYTVLFESTRNKTNAFRGGFGLGCKVPFAYADQFTVETRWHGTRYDYVMYRDSSAIPTCALIATTPTPEPNGVTVSVAINPDDVPIFQAAANNILPWFGHQITTNTPITALPTLWKGPTAEIIKLVNYRVNTNFVARIGNVIYPIPDTTTRDLLQHYTNPNYIPYSNFLPDAVIVLDFPIGALQVTPNREDLITGDATTATIRNAIITFITDVHTWLHNQDIADPLTATKQLLPLQTVLRPMKIWPDTVCKQQHKLYSTVLFTRPTNWTIHQLEAYYPRRRGNHTSQLRTLGAPHTNTQIKLPIDKPLTVLYTANPKYLPSRIKNTIVSGTRNQEFILVVTDDTPATIETALTPYNLEPITLTPLSDPPTRTATARKRSPTHPKTVLYNIIANRYETPETTPFYVLGIDRPLSQYAKAALIDYPNTPPTTLHNMLRDLKHLVPDPSIIPDTVYLYGPAQHTRITKNPAARELKPLLDSLKPHIPHEELNAHIRYEQIRDDIDAYACAKYDYTSRYNTQQFVESIPTHLNITDNLDRLAKLLPKTARNYTALQAMLNLYPPPCAKYDTSELIALLSHYNTFIKHGLNPSEPTILALIRMYDAATPTFD